MWIFLILLTDLLHLINLLIDDGIFYAEFYILIGRHGNSDLTDGIYDAEFYIL